MKDPEEKDKVKVTVREEGGEEILVTITASDLEEIIDLIFGKDE